MNLSTALFFVGGTSAATQPAATLERPKPYVSSPNREKRPTRPKLDPNALERHRKRCTAGNQSSCVELGRFYEEGVGVRADLERATELYENACDRKLQLGCVHLAVLHLEVKEARYKPELGVPLLMTACSQREQLACLELGWLFVDGTVIPAEPVRGRELMEAACQKKLVDACAGAAYLNVDGNTVRDSGRYGVYLRDSLHGTVTNNNVSGSGRSGFSHRPSQGRRVRSMV